VADRKHGSAAAARANQFDSAVRMSGSGLRSCARQLGLWEEAHLRRDWSARRSRAVDSRTFA
jgi:hypothetical protein